MQTKFEQKRFKYRTFEQSKRHHRAVKSDYICVSTFKKLKFYLQFLKSQVLLKNDYCFIVLSFHIR